MGHVSDSGLHGVQISLAKYAYSAVGWAGQTGNNPKQSRLACPVLAEQCVKPPRVEAGTEVVERRKSRKKLAYAFEDNCWLEGWYA
jgi:hypothetical protein